jgi:hypothetical protein
MNWNKEEKEIDMYNLWLIDFKEKSWKEQDKEDDNIELKSSELADSIDKYDELWYNYSKDEDIYYIEDDKGTVETIHRVCK